MKTIFKHGWLITMDMDGIEIKLGWGIVKSDETGRWRPNDYVCTSIVKEVRGQDIQTLNSIYSNESTWEPIVCHVDKLGLLQQGLSPVEANQIMDNNLSRNKNEITD